MWILKILLNRKHGTSVEVLTKEQRLKLYLYFITKHFPQNKKQLKYYDEGVVKQL